ncbi:MAG: DUF5916 domain-containing protein [Thermoanaerobaculia bacterium]
MHQREILVLAALAAAAAGVRAAPPPAAEPAPGPIPIVRIDGEIHIDGRLDEEAWSQAVRLDEWFETNPGDNVEPKVANVAYLGYDDRFLYAAFEFADPEPRRIKAPLGDRDNIPSYTDYGGVIVDTRHDGKSAQMFLANARGIQYDAISNDASGEDSSPDFFWESAGSIGTDGWVLEMRIPFSSLRYSGSDPEQWGIMLYRNRPREFRYQMFTSRLPREANCFICNVRPLTGLQGLPSGSHWVAAPYGTASQTSEPRDGLGSSLESDDPTGEIGLDFKWLPNPDTVLDGTINPDFSQIESDVAQIAANERFALFFPEQRPFFLESSDLLSTPIQALFSRTFTAPRWGARATGRQGKTAYTLLVGEDRGGGSVILPGSKGSDLADQDFESEVVMGRVRHDIGQSFVSFLVSDREIDGGGDNRVLGPDFRWQPTNQDTLTGQLLFSSSHTPDRPELADEWDGRELSGHAAELWYYHESRTWDYYGEVNDVADDFRADNGFVPQVGYRRGYGEVGYTFRPEEKPVSRLRVFGWGEHSEDQDGNLLLEGITTGFGMDAVKNSFFRTELAVEKVRGDVEVHERRQIRPYLEMSPGKIFSRLIVDTVFGEEVDFANDRLGDGATIGLRAIFRPTDHLELDLRGTRRWLDVDTDEGLSGRLFTADVARLRGVYTFNARSWLRLVTQWVETERDPALYLDEVEDHSGGLAGSLVFAYKLNWQTVAFLGFSDNREIDELDDLQESGRQIFLKLSYAFQR